MPEADLTFYALVLGSFLAAVSNAAFSSGGAMIVLAVTSTVLPVTAIVPIHSTLLIGSTTSRAIVFRQHIDWRIAGPFLAGSVVAVAIGARIYVDLPPPQSVKWTEEAYRLSRKTDTNSKGGVPCGTPPRLKRSASL